MAMLELSQRFLSAIDRGRLIPRGGSVSVALSGGSDSVALSALLSDTTSEGGFTIANLIHINHQLRGGEADSDEEFCREFAKSIGLPIVVKRVDVGELARTCRVSVEDAGHRARYSIFESVANELKIDVIATGHTRDDLAETVLLRLIRGAGPAGLAGIWPQVGCVVRPLLDISRCELREYLSMRDLAFREDATNYDVRIPRNRVRHALIPFLAKKFSPSIGAVLAREAAIARADSQWMDSVASQEFARVVGCRENEVTIDGEALNARPVALARRVAKMALERVSNRGVGFVHVERLLDLVANPDRPITEADFPGSRIERQGKCIVVSNSVTVPLSRRKTSEPRGFKYELTVPGEVVVKEADLVVSAERGCSPNVLCAKGDTVAVTGNDLTLPLVLRSWHPGDAFRPLGLGGRKKLQDFFVDRKIACEKRRSIPLVTDTRRGIVWVVGHGISEEFRVTNPNAVVLLLKSRKLGVLG